jgi:hypothetical protein
MLRAATTTACWIFLTGGLLLTPTSSQALTAELANKCRDMAIAAHPTVMYGPSGSAAAQREYFSTCVARNGNMQDQNQTTGAAPSK